MKTSWLAQLKLLVVPIYLSIVFMVATLTYGLNYGSPAAQFWDENYHIASAQKYFDGAFFMEPHPPLGKLFIALGEKMWHPNDGVQKVFYDTDAKRCKTFDQTDFVKDFPSKTEQCQNIFRLASKGGECVNIERWTNEASDAEKKLTATPVADTFCQEAVKPMSYAGYRFFPVIFAILIAPLFFLILLFFTRNPHISLAFTSLYLFDNALIVHSRAAMLESTQGFFIMGALAYFAYLWSRRGVRTWVQYLTLGVLIGLVVSTKLNGLILVLLPLLLMLRELYAQKVLPQWIDKLDKTTFVALLKKIPRLIGCLLVCFGTAAVVFCAIYFIHFSLARNLQTHDLTNKNYYINQSKILKLSDEERCKQDAGKTGFLECRYLKFKAQMDAGQQTNLRAFPRQMLEHISFTQYYNDGVPELDVTKSGENGSSPWTWPIGNKTINYRWEIAWSPGLGYSADVKISELCDKNVWTDGDKTAACSPLYDTVQKVCDSQLSDSIKQKVCSKDAKYLYLQGNPAAWSLSLIGVLFAVALIISRVFFGLKIIYPRLFGAICSLLLLYIAYMISVMQIKRVLYLYHYFIPLMLGMLLAALVFTYISRPMLKFLETRRFVYALCILLVCTVFAVYSFFSPLTYYKPLSKEQFNERIWNRDWQLKAVN